MTLALACILTALNFLMLIINASNGDATFAAISGIGTCGAAAWLGHELAVRSRRGK